MKTYAIDGGEGEARYLNRKDQELELVTSISRHGTGKTLSFLETSVMEQMTADSLVSSD